MGEEEGTVRLGVRLPASLHHKIEQQAREHHRSLNSEIVTLLGVGLEAEQFLFNSERRLRESERRVDDSARRVEERMNAQDAQIRQLVSHFQTITERPAIVLPEETIGLLEAAREAAERRGKTLGDLFDEVIRKLVSEEQPE